MRVGYCGGDKEKPTYRSMGDHTEAVAIDYDPTIISYENLLERFWKSHRCDLSNSSRQYMNAVFYINEKQQKLANISLETQAKQKGIASDKIATKILPAKDFTYAEGYHQKYALGRYRELRAFLDEKYPSAKELADSTVATRLNGYLANGRDKDWVALKKDLPEYGLPERLEKELLKVIQATETSGND